MPGPVDKRFPRLYAIDDPRVPDGIAVFANEVCVRCQCRVAYDIKLELMHFYYSEADAGILFRPRDNVIAEFPQFPVTRSYDELGAAFLHAAEGLDP